MEIGQEICRFLPAAPAQGGKGNKGRNQFIRMQKCIETVPKGYRHLACGASRNWGRGGEKLLSCIISRERERERERE